MKKNTKNYLTTGKIDNFMLKRYISLISINAFHILNYRTLLVETNNITENCLIIQFCYLLKLDFVK